ncbi:hypothetical protein IE81DRAFT_144964 [Ceraceosorus guamensis]|uniref:Uncharacterized protein n=1 Tax=Ceraceosorus guamensis TaxID=1522189 RepID=A0A316VX38_9BASI|nr:hypothetical protein IE81DRAFT_144964 [Ceraceosorus guamensis]PWN42019.1 hypothetical protein IE81DRAFT_144964 [Ceraceosorus guamensis]
MRSLVIMRCDAHWRTCNHECELQPFRSSSVGCARMGGWMRLYRRLNRSWLRRASNILFAPRLDKYTGRHAGESRSHGASPRANLAVRHAGAIAQTICGTLALRCSPQGKTG